MGFSGSGVSVRIAVMNLDELIEMVSAGRPGIRTCCDSRLVRPGDCFTAVKGETFDGHDFIGNAVEKGAAYIVAERDVEVSGAEVVKVKDASSALGLLAQAAMGNPSAEMANLAVTGTNGKTTVAFLVHSVITHAVEKCGLIGTVYYNNAVKSEAASLTTPTPILIARMAREMVDAGAKYMVVEASSHALKQNRLAGIDFTAAAFTNLTGDHLDYHGTVDDYFASKTKLFSGLLPHAVAVLNRQSEAAQKIAERTEARILWYAVDEPADITAYIKSMDIDKTVFEIEFEGDRQTVETPLIGKYNVSNHLAAAGLCLAAGFELHEVAPGLSALKCVPGRLEPVRTGRGFKVFVDYAHTDDAIRNVLATLRPLCEGRIIIVFGCGGDRDKSKRPRMAGAARAAADIIIVTSDNPRNEDPSGIIDDIMAVFEEDFVPSVTVEPDREKAIERSVNLARDGDIVLIAGKGHETYQLIGGRRLDFSDVRIAEKYLKKLS